MKPNKGNNILDARSWRAREWAESERFRTDRKSQSLAGGGAWMIAIALQVIPTTWPNLLRPHPWAVGVFVLVGAALFAYAAFGHRPSSGISNSAGRDNFGDAIRGRDVHKEVHHHYPAAVATVPPAAEPPKPAATVLFSEPELVTVSFNRTAWHRSDKGVGGVIVWVHNKNAAMGEIAEKLTGLIASISYSEALGVPGHVSRAYWIEHSGNEIDIEIGDRKAILIGTLYGTSLKVCENSRREAWFPPKSGHWVMPVLRETVVEFREKLDIEIAVISPSTGRTIQTAKLELTKVNSSMKIESRHD